MEQSTSNIDSSKTKNVLHVLITFVLRAQPMGPKSYCPVIPVQ